MAIKWEKGSSGRRYEEPHPAFRSIIDNVPDDPFRLRASRLSIDIRSSVVDSPRLELLPQAHKRVGRWRGGGGGLTKLKNSSYKNWRFKHPCCQLSMVFPRPKIPWLGNPGPRGKTLCRRTCGPRLPWCSSSKPTRIYITICFNMNRASDSQDKMPTCLPRLRR